MTVITVMGGKNYVFMSYNDDDYHNYDDDYNVYVVVRTTLTKPTMCKMINTVRAVMFKKLV